MNLSIHPPSVFLLNQFQKCLTLCLSKLELELTFQKPKILFGRKKRGTPYVHPRHVLLVKSVRLEHLSNYDAHILENLFCDYNDLFFLTGDKLEDSVVKAEFAIVTQPCQPKAAKIYHIPERHRAEVEHQTTDLLKQRIITHSTSPWNAPVYVVPKKIDADGLRKWRVVIDYHLLNEQMVDDEYPLPRIDDILDQLSNAKYFTTLDLASGFHQIPIKPEDQ